MKTNAKFDENRKWEAKKLQAAFKRADRDHRKKNVHTRLLVPCMLVAFGVPFFIFSESSLYMFGGCLGFVFAILVLVFFIKTEPKVYGHYTAHGDYDGD